MTSKDQSSETEPTGYRRKILAKKIHDLNQLFSSSESGTKKAAAEEDSRTLSLSNLATNLFSKAPVDFLEKTALHDLVEITRNCESGLVDFGSEECPFIVRHQNRADSTSFFTIVGDRPFIVNSISECLESLGFKLSVFLHPILIKDGLRISLIYFQTDLLTAEQIQVVSRHLESTLSDLLLATDDFTSILVRTETLARIMENPTYRTRFTQSERREVADFLRWLTDGGFIFLGYAEWRTNSSELPEQEPNTVLGVYKTTQSYKAQLLSESWEDCQKAASSQEAIFFSKLRTESLVHRRVRLNTIIIPEFSTDGRLVAWHSLVGLLTSKGLAQESSSIPLIRRKLQKLIELEEVVHNSHDYKYIVDIIDRMPKDQALRLDIEGLREIIHTIIGLQNRNETRVSLRFDSSKRGLCVLIVMPRERFNSYVRGEIQQYVETTCGAPPASSEYHLDLSNKPLARFYFYVPLAGTELPALDLARFENDINDISRTWDENLEERLLLQGEFSHPSEVWFRYSRAFPEEYQALHSPAESLTDISQIEQLTAEQGLRVSFRPGFDAAADLDLLTVYSRGNEVSISKAFPVLENAGLEVINEKASCITPFGSEPIFIHRYLVRPKNGSLVEHSEPQQILESGLTKVLRGQAENDFLNSLMLEARLDVRAISLLRTYAGLLWQVTNFATRRTIVEAFSLEPSVAKLFWEIFEVRFNPDLKLERTERDDQFARGIEEYMDLLHNITDINRDRILRAYLSLLEYTVRTNFYQNTPTIALKILSEKVEIMPNPRPKFEIFVSSPIMEGTHLRGAAVARGGIRWSDRPDDFRNEVLGLVKTQKVKNAVIVPNGAKGGFILRTMPKEPEQIGPAVENAYRLLIRSLLSLTDNKIDGQIIHPPRTIIYDSDDPYLVVAADKGTAAFSDIANKVAVNEYNFWLDDAFASGGSQGYDHKKYGITAKGAWQCVKRHFHDLGIDYSNEPFTVVGIGDMAGDVFGNGMILSAKIKLLGAFNHKHIFVDPNPDPIRSFEERQRLFRLPRSQWSDYNPATISQGGGVFSRFDKEITITPEMREALSLPSEGPTKVSGEQLISLILRAKVDLLWNGGIGTYVKAQDETHAEVNDGTNDRVRINAGDIRARVVSEGGNLGLTQRARIEFASRGGRINTDAIDNSAGVDLSDHEVNIKILCSALMKSGKITRDQRDELLKEIATDVVESVLQHNRNHALLLSIGIRRSFKSIEYYKSLIRFLHKANYINRHLECLPDDEEFNDRILKKQGLTSPELAVFLAGVKMWIKDVIFESPLCQDPRLESFLLDYFPVKLQRSFRDDIVSHALNRSIIASQVANTLIDSVGITFVHRMCITHSTRPTIVIKCLLAAEIILRAKQLRASLDQFDNFTHNNTFLKLRQGIGKTLRDATSWIISYHGQQLDLDEIVKLYDSSFQTLMKHADELFTGEVREQYFERLKNYRTSGLDDYAARTLAVAPNIIPVLEMLWASRKSNRNIRLVATVFSQIIESLGIGAVLQVRETIDTSSKWEHQLLLSAFEEIRRSVSLLTCEILKKNVSEKSDVTRIVQSSPSYEELNNTLEEIRSGSFSAAALSIISKQLRTYQIP